MIGGDSVDGDYHNAVLVQLKNTQRKLRKAELHNTDGYVETIENRVLVSEAKNEILVDCMRRIESLVHAKGQGGVDAEALRNDVKAAIESTRTRLRSTNARSIRQSLE